MGCKDRSWEGGGGGGGGGDSIICEDGGVSSCSSQGSGTFTTCIVCVPPLPMVYLSPEKHSRWQAFHVLGTSVCDGLFVEGEVTAA